MKEELFKAKEQHIIDRFEGLRSNHIRMHVPFKVKDYFSREEIKILQKHKLIKR